MRLEVRETIAAKQDRLEIWLYIANDSVRAADELGPGIRAIPVANYMIYYRFQDEAVYVLRVLHAARDITPDLLSD